MDNFDNFMHDMMVPISGETRAFADSLYGLFSNLVKAGFKEDQAMTIILRIIGGAHADNV